MTSPIKTSLANLVNFGRFCQILANFGRLVLSCIDVSDSESRRIFQDFSKSTRSAFFRTAPNLNFNEICNFLPNYGEFSKILHTNSAKSRHFAKIVEFGVVQKNADLVDFLDFEKS